MAGFSRTRWLAVAASLLFLAVNFALFRLVGEAEAYPQRRSLAEFPTQLTTWRCPKRTIMTEDVFRISEVNDYLLCNFVPDAETPQRGGYVNVYIGYHALQMRSGGSAVGDAEAAIHPPKHCLPGSGWDIVDAETVSLDVEGLPTNPSKANRFLIAKGKQRQIVYYWYQSRGRVIASDYAKVAYLALDRVLRQRTDGALVRFTAPVVDDEERAERDLQAVMREVVPRLPDYLPD